MFHNIIKISILICLINIIIVNYSNGQVLICKDNLSTYPIDYQLLLIRDSLKEKRIDTIIIYRHWPQSKDLDGYGKVIWKEKGNVYQCKLILENQVFKSIIFSKLSSDSIFNFFFLHKIDTISKNPTKTIIKVERDALHFVDVTYYGNDYCFVITGFYINQNPENLRSQFIKLLADESVSGVIFEEKIVPITPKKHKRKFFKSSS